MSWLEKSKLPFPIVLCDLPKNIGFAGALNVGYFMSSGEYIAVNDADDISHPSRFEKQVEFLEIHPEYDIIGTNYATFTNGDIENAKVADWLQYGQDIKKSLFNW